MIRAEWALIELNFLTCIFFLVLTVNFVRVIARQLARKSSSADFNAFLNGIWSSWFGLELFLDTPSSTTIVSVPYEPSGRIIVFVIIFGFYSSSFFYTLI